MAWAAILVATITQFSDQSRSRVILQLIKGISRVLQKLQWYFNGTIISTFSIPVYPVLPVNFNLRLNKSVVALASVKPVTARLSSIAGISLPYWNKIPDVSE